MKNIKTLYAPWIILIVVIILLPIITNNPYIISMMLFVAIYGTLAIGMGILMGHAGLFSLTQPTWFGLGAYVAGILAVRGITPPWLGIIIGCISVAGIAFIMGVFVLKLEGVFLACATFGILVSAQIVFIQLENVTGGHSGLLNIPPLSIGGFVFRNDLSYYFLSWALCIGCLAFSSNVINSRVGRAIKASRDSEVGSESLGVNIPKYRLQIFVLTAVMAGLAGSIFCFYLRFVAPSSFGFSLLVELLLMIVIGGIGNVWGCLLGSFIITFVHAFLNQYFGELLPVMTSEVTNVFFGTLIILIIIFMPHGLFSQLEKFVVWGGRGYEYLKDHISK